MLYCFFIVSNFSVIFVLILDQILASSHSPLWTEEYEDLVCVVTRQLELKEFLTLVSEHQCVLSPPGRGYDCGRTWQAVAVGTVPLVVDDALLDHGIIPFSPASPNTPP